MKRLTLALTVLFLSTQRPVFAAEPYVANAAYGLLATVANVGYVPAKVAYALLGGIVGGIAYLVTGADSAPANAVWAPALGGTYVLTPEMLRGREPVEFIAAGCDDCERDRQRARVPQEPVADEPLP